MSRLDLTFTRFDPDLGVRIVPELTLKQKEILAVILLAYVLGDRRIHTIGCVGKWGGGKSMIALLVFVLLCIINSDPDCQDEDMLPCSGIWARTEDDAIRSTVAELLQVCPPELIRKHTRDYILWEFGHKTWIYSAKKSAEGPNLTHCLADEIQSSEYAGRTFENIKARARSDRAKVHAVIVVGLVEAGHLEGILRYPKPDAGPVFYRILLPEDNPANPPGYADEIRSATAGEEFDEDGWFTRTGAVYPKFSTRRNILPTQVRDDLRDRARLTDRPIALGIDLRQRAVAVIAVPVEVECFNGRNGWSREAGWMAVDQVVVDDCGDGELAIQTAARIRQMGWHVEAGVSEACFEPVATDHELDAFRSAIPGLKCIRPTKGGAYQREDDGIKCVSWNVCDGHGNARWLVHHTLDGDSYRGVPEAMRGWQLAQPRDKKFEDANDAVRYLLCRKSPVKKVKRPRRIKVHNPALMREGADLA